MIHAWSAVYHKMSERLPRAAAPLLQAEESGVAGLIDYLGWDLTHLQYDPEENHTRFQLVAGVLEVRRRG